jgi:hypothetical protein
MEGGVRLPRVVSIGKKGCIRFGVALGIAFFPWGKKPVRGIYLTSAGKNGDQMVTHHRENRLSQLGA